MYGNGSSTSKPLSFYPEKVKLVIVHKQQKTVIPLDSLKFSLKQVDFVICSEHR